MTARFDGGCLSSDAGSMLLGEVDARIGLLDRVAQCFRITVIPANVSDFAQILAQLRCHQAWAPPE